MPKSAKHTFTLVKVNEVSLSESKLDSEITAIKARILGGNRSEKGWKCRHKLDIEKPRSPGLPHTYKVTFTLTCTSTRTRQPDVVQREFEHIVFVATKNASGKKWFPESVDGDEAEAVRASADREVGYAEFALDPDWKNWFADLYNRDDQLEILFGAIDEAVATEFQNRFNIILYGPPGSGKTEIVRCMKRKISPECWVEFDSTNTTAAGAIAKLTQREFMPRFLFLEELEKVRNEDDIRWILSATDQRGEIRKVNFRTDIQRETKFLTICTVNDLDKLKKMLGTALQSRFPFQILCPHPDKLTMSRILERDIRRRPSFKDSDLRWIEPAVTLSEELNVHDPRSVVAWCLTGKDKLFDGEWQKKIRKLYERTAQQEVVVP